MPIVLNVVRMLLSTPTTSAPSVPFTKGKGMFTVLCVTTLGMIGGKSVRTRGQTVTLKNKKSGHEVRLLVILSDSRQGYLASDSLSKAKEGNWAWYNLNEWSEI